MKSIGNNFIVACRKLVLVVILLAMNALAFAQSNTTKDYTTLKGLSFGVGVPLECKDLPGMGRALVDATHDRKIERMMQHNTFMNSELLNIDTKSSTKF